MYIVALGRIEEDVLGAIELDLGRVFGCDVRRMPGLPEPEYAYDVQRGQHSSAHILRQLIGQVPKNAVSLLGITQKDLFIPMLTFVLGQAQLGGPVSVVSLARLHQHFYGLPPDGPLVVMRAVKEAVHEVGHTVGLTHCADSACPMSLSNTVRHVDAKGTALCSNCQMLLEEEKSKHVRFMRSASQGAGTGKI
jgi:archaemetzincin